MNPWPRPVGSGSVTFFRFFHRFNTLRHVAVMRASFFCVIRKPGN